MSTNQPTFRLTLAKGPAPGQVFELTRSEHTIGRAAPNDISIPENGVSRVHAWITRQGEDFVLEDLGNTTGTFVNDQRLSGPHVLAAGDRVRLGDTVELIFEMVMSPPLASPGPTPAFDATILAGPPTPPSVKPPTVHDGTMVSTGLEPPELLVETAGEGTQRFTLTADHVTIGRAEDNHIQLSSKIVSRHHARLEKSPEGYRILPLPDVANPLSLGGRPLIGPHLLSHGDVLRIGGSDPGLMVTFRYSWLATAAESLRPAVITFDQRTLLQIGRDASNDVRLDAPQVSRYHAQIERVGARFRLRDLRSTNGTFVNGERITGEVWLMPNDQVRIGSFRIAMGEARLTRYDESGDLRVDVIGLNKWVRKDLNILQDIHLSLQPRELVVVVGRSGGGKSTLVDAIAGYRPASHGRVLVNGLDIYRHFDAIRSDIGYVPQRDIIHMELTVYQALDYAARLRMPPDTSRAERHKRVMEVLEDLDLVQRKDVQVSSLSGGQQKRVSIGVELLTKPGLFFLDEPTSGLDPETETGLMRVMRGLADQGRTIVLITHATKNVMLADKVIFLARGGYLAWFGPPDEALKYFDRYRSERDRRVGEIEFDHIYAILDDPGQGAPADWARRYQEHPAYQQYVAKPLQSAGRSTATPEPAAQAVAPRHRRQLSALRQFLILSARNLRILSRDRFSLILMVAVAPLIGSLDFVLAPFMGRNPFDFFDGNARFSIITLFAMTINAILVGALAQMREIIKEQDVYKRERLVNLKILPYVLSKVWVAALLASVHAAAYVFIRYLAYDMPGGTDEIVLIYITVVLAAMSGMMLGLLASALASNPNTAPLIVILFIMPQFLLSGALVPLPGRGQLVSAITSSRWAFEALVSITGVGSDVRADACWRMPEEERRLLSLEYKNANCRCMGTNMFDSCVFPGLGHLYDPAIDRPEPTRPPEIGDPPPEPIWPKPPTAPEDQADNVAVAEYLTALDEYQREVETAQAERRAELEAYQAEANLYEAGVLAYTEDFGAWQTAQASAAIGAESLIANIQDKYDWAFVDRRDLTAFTRKIGTRWLVELVIILIEFGLILALQRRKDVI